MDEFVKAFEKFILRDLSYVIGGGAVVLSFLHILGIEPREHTPTLWYLVGAGGAYALGYAIQDFLGLCHVIQMKAGHPEGPISSMLYGFYDREDPKPFKQEDYEKGKRWLYTCAPQRYRDDHQRTEGLKQVGFTIGSCFIISAGILLLIGTTKVDAAIGKGLLVIGMILYLLGWLKVTQQTQYVLRFKDKKCSARNPYESCFRPTRGHISTGAKRKRVR